MHTIQIETPVGRLTLSEDGGHLIRVGWRSAALTDYSPLLSEVARQLEQYFSGTRQTFDLPLSPAPSPAAQAARDAMMAIRYGATATYGDLAAQSGTSPRDFGQQCGTNPLPIIVPCHRVLPAQGLGHYSGGDGPRTKAWLLALEGSVLL